MDGASISSKKSALFGSSRNTPMAGLSPSPQVAPFGQKGMQIKMTGDNSPDNELRCQKMMDKRILVIRFVLAIRMYDHSDSFLIRNVEMILCLHILPPMLPKFDPR